MSLNKEILFRLISNQIKNPELIWLTKLIIFNDPIKNFTSKGNRSLFANDPPLELIEKMLATVNSYFGHFKHADTFKLRTHLWENRFQKLRNYIEPKDPDLTCLQIKPEFLERAGRAR